MANTANQALKDLEDQFKQAFENLEAIYYTPTSPHYKDNERYSWAVKTLNEKYEQLKKDLYEKQHNLNNHEA